MHLFIIFFLATHTHIGLVTPNISSAGLHSHVHLNEQCLPNTSQFCFKSKPHDRWRR